MAIILTSSSVHICVDLSFAPFSFPSLQFVTLPTPLLLFPLQGISALRFSTSFTFSAVTVLRFLSFARYHFIVLATSFCLKAIGLDLGEALCLHELPGLILLALQLTAAALVLVATKVFCSTQIIFSAELFTSSLIFS
jgi:hypothetical protein